MINSFVNISDSLDRPTVDLYRSVDEAAKSVGAAYLVVGASARDLLLQHGYGMKVIRATADTDFGVQVTTWKQFQDICRFLIDSGFQETHMTHRLVMLVPV